MLPQLSQNVVRKHLYNIMTTFIHVAKCYDIHNVVATFLQYGKIRVDYIISQTLTELKSDAHTISMAD